MKKYFLIILFKITLVSFSAYADQKTDYFSKNCYHATTLKIRFNALRNGGMTDIKFGPTYKIGTIQTKEAFYPKTSEDRLVCQLNQGSCEAKYTMTILVYETFAWGEEKPHRHECFFNERGDVTFVN